MIRYALVCEQAHEFEAWFGSSADYDSQLAQDLIACPFCETHAVRKQIMAPAVSGSRDVSLAGPPPEVRAAIREGMARVRRHVESHFDYVGDRFAREARDIHEGVSEPRPVYGEATLAEVRALNADGVPIAPLPPAVDTAADPLKKLN